MVRSYSQTQRTTLRSPRSSQPLRPGWPTTFSVGRSPVGGGSAGHVEMAESLISTRLLEIISNGSAGNGKSPEQPPLPDFQAHFHGHQGGTGQLGVADALSGWCEPQTRRLPSSLIRSSQLRRLGIAPAPTIPKRVLR